LRYLSLARRCWWNFGSLTCEAPRHFEEVQGGFLDCRTPQINYLRSSKLWILLAQTLSVKCQKLPSLGCFIWENFITAILKCTVVFLDKFIYTGNFRAKSYSLSLKSNSQTYAQVHYTHPALSRDCCNFLFSSVITENTKHSTLKSQRMSPF
jgi:hypothetical protein